MSSRIVSHETLSPAARRPASAAASDTGGAFKGTVYEGFMALVSVLSIANVVAVGLASLAGSSGPGREVIVAMDAIITPLFLLDFAYRLRTAASWHRYLVRELGWADLVAILPLLRIFRLLRLRRVSHTIRANGMSRFLADVRASRAAATFLLTVFLVIVVVEVAAATIYYAEGGAEGSNIESANDAIWWSLVTITTVGYGDRYPVTTQGRVIGVFLLFAGIALFSVLTGFIANVFLAPKGRLVAKRRPDDPYAVIAAARLLLTEQDERTEAIRLRLDELEHVVDAAARHPAGQAGPDGG